MTAPADQEAFVHCEALVRAHDKDRFLANLFVPAEHRRHFFALHAFHFEMARVRVAVRDPMAGAIRLQWWREALLGERPGEATASPVAAAIVTTLAGSGIDRTPLLDLIELRRAELFGEPVTSVEPNVFLTAARLLGGEGASLHAVAESAGLAYDWSRDPARQDAAREHYTRFRAGVREVLPSVRAAFLPLALVPLRLAKNDPPQWRRQIALLRAAWFGF